MRKTYIKKLIAVEAIQYDGTNAEELIEALGLDAALEDGDLYWHRDGCPILIRKGDYIVREDEAKRWSICLNAAFESDYQEDFAF